MAFPVYSTKFIEVLNVSNSSGRQSYTVPAGYRAVVRYISAFISSSSTGQLAEFNGASSEAMLVFVNSANTFSNFAVVRIVFNPGDVFGFNVATGTWNLYASGYLLTLP